VSLQDVPRESLQQHLGFGKDDEEARDEIDERLARMRINPTSLALLTMEFFFFVSEHTRYVYNLQESTTINSSDESSDWDSDESASNAGWQQRRGRSVSSSQGTTAKERKKRMSLLTGQYFDVVDHHHHHHHDLDLKSGAKRKFFQSAELGTEWEDMCGVDGVVASRMGMINGKYGAADLSVLMERGGRDEYLVDEGYAEDEELTMVVEP